MYAGQEFACTPVTTVERLFVREEERAGNALFRAGGDQQTYVVGRVPGKNGEKIRGEIGRGSMLRIGGRVAAIEKTPVFFCCRVPVEPAVFQLVGGGATAILTDFLAFGVVEAGKKSVEVGVVAVDPMKLYAMSDHEAGVGQPFRFVFVDEKQMERGDAAIHGDIVYRVRQFLARLGVDAEQTRAGDGGERNGAHQLGVILETMLGVSVGPCPVEHVFTPGVLLEIERHRCPQLAGDVCESEMMRRPARAGSDAA